MFCSPWYNCSTKNVQPFVIGICGGSASGKTTIAEKIVESVAAPGVSLLSMDSFYKVLSEDEKDVAQNNEYNFDHPDAFDFELLASTLERLKQGEDVAVPVYDFTTHAREGETTVCAPKVIIFEGILTFHNERILSMLDMKIFVEADADVRLARRLRRDISQRGRGLEGVLKQYTGMVQPAFNRFIAPLKDHADLIIPSEGQNDVAVKVLAQHVRSQLRIREDGPSLMDKVGREKGLGVEMTGEENRDESREL